MATMMLLSVLQLVHANEAESLSLLQMQISKHTIGVQSSLPDPEHKSSDTVTPAEDWSNEPRDLKADHDFKCNGGKGNWIWVLGQPMRRSDLSENTTDIIKKKCIPWKGGEYCYVIAQENDPSRGQMTPKQFTHHGPVRDEKDCFARARISYPCVHWSEDLRNNPGTIFNYGLWYAPFGDWGDVNGTCYCGQTLQKTQITVAPYKTRGFWFCQLEAGDFAGVDENTPKKTTTSTTTTTTTTSTTTTAALLCPKGAAVGVKRGSSCPAGSVVANTAQLCEVAAQSAGFSYGGDRPTNPAKGHRRPCGCWANLKAKKAYHNTFQPCLDSGRGPQKHAAPLCCKV